MFNPQMELLTTVLKSAVERLAAAPADAAPWAEAAEALRPSRAAEPELARVIDAKDLAALRKLIEEWNAGKRHLPVQDREVLARAMKAFRKSLKVTRLDAESSIAGGPMSAGRESSILGIRPPDRYPRAVWDELARQGRLVAGRHGLFELPAGERSG
jgi:hypothetical protein